MSFESDEAIEERDADRDMMKQHWTLLLRDVKNTQGPIIKLLSREDFMYVVQTLQELEYTKILFAELMKEFELDSISKESSGELID